MAGLYGLRVADQVRIDLGNEQVGALYTGVGQDDPHGAAVATRSPLIRCTRSRAC